MEGDLLKVHVNLPNYWERKQRFVDYGRIDTPNDFKILVKVISSEDIGKRGKRKMVICRTVNMDQVDEQGSKILFTGRLMSTILLIFSYRH